MKKTLKVLLIVLALGIIIPLSVEKAMADPPSLVSSIDEISLSTSEVTAPNSIEVTVKFTKGTRDYSHASIYFCCGGLDNELGAALTETSPGILKGTISTEGAKSGIYYYDRIFFDYYQGEQFIQSENYKNRWDRSYYYLGEGRYVEKVWEMPAVTEYLCFKVNGVGEVQSPTIALNSITFDDTQVFSPKKVGVTVDASIDASEINKLSIMLEGTSGSVELSKGIDGKYHGKIPLGFGSINEYHYVYSISAVDSNGNTTVFVDSYSEGNNQYLLPSGIRGKGIQTLFDIFSIEEDAFMGMYLGPDVNTNGIVMNIELNQPGNYLLFTDSPFSESDKETIIQKEIFEAIKAKGSKITGVGFDYTWAFDGKDILSSTRDFDIDISHYLIDDVSSEEDLKIKELVGDKKASIIHFKDSGVSIGQSTLHLWLSDEELEKLGSFNLSLYSYDSINKKLTLLGEKKRVTNDGYLEIKVNSLDTLVLVGNMIPSSIEDTTAPTLISVKLLKTEVETSGSVPIEVIATDDISDVANVELRFNNQGDNLGAILYYDDGIWKGTLNIPEYSMYREYTVTAVYLSDFSGNSAFYANAEFAQPVPTANNIHVRVSNWKEDLVAPTISSLTISATETTLPGTITVEAVAEDNLSGIEYIAVDFTGKTSGKNANAYLEKCGDIWRGNVNLGEYLPSETYEIESVFLIDKCNNGMYYNVRPTASTMYNDSGEIPAKPLEPYMESLAFTVINNGTPDVNSPALKKISISNPTLEVPGTTVVNVECEDDVSGVRQISASFVDIVTGREIHSTHQNSYVSGDSLIWNVEFNQYVPSGIYVCEDVWIWDNAGNSCGYSTYDGHQPLEFENAVIVVKNSGSGFKDVTSLSNNDYLSVINNADNDATILVDCATTSIVPEDIFDAIIGTEKVINLIGNGITWQFYGKDIINTNKPVDCTVAFYRLNDEDVVEEDAKLMTLIGDNKAVKLHFADNGTLPGKATIQIKADYAMREYLGESNLYVYYYDKILGKLQTIATNISIVDDSYYQFEITHCSDYVITQGAVNTGNSGRQYRGTNAPAVASAATADMGVAMYGVLGISSLLGMGWAAKKKY